MAASWDIFSCVQPCPPSREKKLQWLLGLCCFFRVESYGDGSALWRSCLDLKNAQKMVDVLNELSNSGFFDSLVIPEVFKGIINSVKPMNWHKRPGRTKKLQSWVLDCEWLVSRKSTNYTSMYIYTSSLSFKQFLVDVGGLRIWDSECNWRLWDFSYNGKKYEMADFVPWWTQTHAITTANKDGLPRDFF